MHPNTAPYHLESVADPSRRVRRLLWPWNHRGNSVRRTNRGSTGVLTSRAHTLFVSHTVVMKWAFHWLLLLTLLGSTACARRRSASIVPPKPVLQVDAEDRKDNDHDEGEGVEGTEFFLNRRVVPGETTLP